MYHGLLQIQTMFIESCHNRRTRSFTDVKGRKYKWKHVGPALAMEASLIFAYCYQRADARPSQLWSDDLKNEPIAVFQRALSVCDQKAMLKLGDRAMEIQDL